MIRFQFYPALLASLIFAPQLLAADDLILPQLAQPDESQITEAIRAIRLQLNNHPRDTVDRLNDAWMVELLRTKHYSAVEEFAVAGTLACAADTERVQKLLKFRIEALLAEGKPQEALAAAKSLFNVCNMEFTKDALPLLCDCLTAARPQEPGIVARFKLQILANAQEDPSDRAKLALEYGRNSVMESIPTEKAPYSSALAGRKNLSDYHGLQGTGNLLLLVGRVREAHEVFAQAYRIAPPESLKPATEAIARVIKAEEGGLGKANQFIISIRPKS